MATSTLLHRNWTEIFLIKDSLLRLLLCATTDEDILLRLQNAFPEYFTPEEIQPATPVPASLLRDLTEKYAISEEMKNVPWVREMEWSWALRNLNIPFIKFPPHNEVSDSSDYEWSTPELLEQLTGKTARPGISVRWRGVECLVVGLDWQAGIRLGETIQDGQIFAKYWVELTPAHLIDLNS